MPNEDTDEALSSNTAALFEASREVHDASLHTVLGENADVVHLLASDRMQSLATLTVRHARPSRAAGESAHQTMESLVAHALRHRDADTVAWLRVDGAAVDLRVVYDYHRAHESPDGAGDARWMERTASFRFPVSDPWKAWLARSGKSMSQSELATFLEEHIAEIGAPDDPGPRAMELARALVATDDDTTEVTDADARRLIASPSQLLRMGRKIAMHVETQAEEARDAHGNVTILYRHEAKAEETKGGIKEQVALPHLLVAKVPVLNGGSIYRLPVRLTARVASNRVQWTLTVHRADLAMEDAVTDAAKVFTEKTLVPVFRGTPEPAPK